MPHDANNDSTARSREALDRSGLVDLFKQSRDRLRRMVGLRLDARLRGRVDPSDVIQEAYLEATTRHDAYRKNPNMSPFIWLRFLTGQKLCEFHRRHLTVQARDASRDAPMGRNGLPEASSVVLAAELAGQLTSPSQAAIRAELRARVQQAIERLDPTDREILAMRHFEQLTPAETADVLGLKKSTASMRYLRALERIKPLLGSVQADADRA